MNKDPNILLDGTAPGEDAALDRELDELAQSLTAAFRPNELSAEENEQILSEILTSSEEVVALGEALRFAHAPTDLTCDVHDALLEAVEASSNVSAPNGKVIPFVSRRSWGMGAAALSAVAVAAAVLLNVATQTRSEEIRVSSGANVVGTAAVQTPEARTERLARARASDFRNNRFRSWGVE